MLSLLSDCEILEGMNCALIVSPVLNVVPGTEQTHVYWLANAQTSALSFLVSIFNVNIQPNLRVKEDLKIFQVDHQGLY